MTKLKRANITVYLIAGNHDAASQLSKSLRLPDNVHLFNHRKAETMLLEHLETAIHGQSFAKGKISEDLSLKYPEAKSAYFNIGLLHTSLNGRQGHDRYAPCHIAGLRDKGYDYWALGHVHKREVVSQEPWIVFPGNIQGRHIRESDEIGKGCTIVQVEHQEIVSVKHHTLDVLRWFICTIDASDCDSADSVLERVYQHLDSIQLKQPDHFLAIRLIISGQSPAHTELQARTDYWQEECRSQANELGNIWLEKILIQTEILTDLDQALQNDDAIGNLLRYLHSDEKEQSLLTTWLQEEFQHLRLPKEYLDAQQMDLSFDPDNTEQQQHLLQSAQAQLIHRLLKAHSHANS